MSEIGVDVIAIIEHAVSSAFCSSTSWKNHLFTIFEKLWRLTKEKSKYLLPKKNLDSETEARRLSSQLSLTYSADLPTLKSLRSPLRCLRLKLCQSNIDGFSILLTKPAYGLTRIVCYNCIDECDQQALTIGSLCRNWAKRHSSKKRIGRCFSGNRNVWRIS